MVFTQFFDCQAILSAPDNVRMHNGLCKLVVVCSSTLIAQRNINFIDKHFVVPSVIIKITAQTSTRDG